MVKSVQRCHGRFRRRIADHQTRDVRSVSYEFCFDVGETNLVDVGKHDLHSLGDEHLT